MTEEQGFVTEDRMCQLLDAALPHLNALNKALEEACPEAPPRVAVVTLLAFYLGRATLESDDFVGVINGALDIIGARYRLQRRGH